MGASHKITRRNIFISFQFLDHYKKMKVMTFWTKFVTTDECWVPHFSPETKWSSPNTHSSPPKKLSKGDVDFSSSTNKLLCILKGVYSLCHRGLQLIQNHIVNPEEVGKGNTDQLPGEQQQILSSCMTIQCLIRHTLWRNSLKHLSERSGIALLTVLTLHCMISMCLFLWKGLLWSSKITLTNMSKMQQVVIECWMGIFQQWHWKTHVTQ